MAYQNITPLGFVNGTDSGLAEFIPFGFFNDEGEGEGPTYSYYYLGSTIDAGGWTPSAGATLWDTVNEDRTTIDGTKDGDFDQSSLSPNNDTMILAFANVLTPIAGTHMVSYRIRGDNCNMTVALYCGDTLVQSWSHIPAPTSFTTFDQTVDESNIDYITDYSALRLHVTATV